MGKKEFLDMMNFRHACKLFDTNRKISEDDFKYILEAARLSPSSFGMEPWRFLVIENQKIKEDLKPLCWNQNQITTCSHLVIIKTDNKALKDRDYILKMFKRRGLDEESTKAYIKRYENFLKNQNISCWSAKQCYIAAANMMSAAAFIGIDSCPIEGFDKDKVQKYLKVDGKNIEVVLILAFGYRVKNPSKKQRLSLEEIVERIK